MYHLVDSSVCYHRIEYAEYQWNTNAAAAAADAVVQI